MGLAAPGGGDIKAFMMAVGSMMAGGQRGGDPRGLSPAARASALSGHGTVAWHQQRGKLVALKDRVGRTEQGLEGAQEELVEGRKRLLAMDHRRRQEVCCRCCF